MRGRRAPVAHGRARRCNFLPPASRMRQPPGARTRLRVAFAGPLQYIHKWAPPPACARLDVLRLLGRCGSDRRRCLPVLAVVQALGARLAEMQGARVNTILIATPRLWLRGDHLPAFCPVISFRCVHCSLQKHGARGGAAGRRDGQRPEPAARSPHRRLKTTAGSGGAGGRRRRRASAVHDALAGLTFAGAAAGLSALKAG